jgi:hypothetical protein
LLPSAGSQHAASLPPAGGSLLRAAEPWLWPEKRVTYNAQHVRCVLHNTQIGMCHTTVFNRKLGNLETYAVVQW